MKIVLATNNAHKLSEIRAILGNEVEFLCLADIDCHDDIPETSDTLEGNALQKARYVYERYGLNVFADDTGLEIAALDGRPGVHTARYAFPDRNDTEANIDKILGEKVDGYITTERLGTDGFGYDPVFSPEETGKTFAELGVEVKNRFSHRARAVRKLCAFLTSLR